MRDFIKDILIEEYKGKYLDVYNNSEIIKYLDKKTGAIEGNSKTRRSLGNIYAIYSVLQAYIEDGYYNNKEKYLKHDGFEYTRLWNFCRSQYGGSKIQNHALNNRLNTEFLNKISKDSTKELLVINGSKYLIHVDYIYVTGYDISKTIIKIIEKYIELLKAKDFKLEADLDILLKLEDPEEKKFKILNLLEDKSEARIFEIISYTILKNHYKNVKIYIGTSLKNIHKERLCLYKTGRTNANDGGIDFVMKPLGRFFQVTEVSNYDKYLLDIDKVMHFPITFVVKTTQTKDEVYKAINEYIEVKSGGMEIIKQRYKDSIEEIITINELKEWLINLNNNDIDTLIDDINTYFKLEMNIEEETEEVNL